LTRKSGNDYAVPRRGIYHKVEEIEQVKEEGKYGIFVCWKAPAKFACPVN
jgi:hypothetical protein